MTIPLFVLNLASSADRLESLRAGLDREGLVFTRIDAFDGRAIQPTSHPDYDDRAMRAVMGRPLLGGELGCVISHRRALQAFLDSGSPWGVVLEDDVTLGPAFGQMVGSIADWLDEYRPGWRVVNLGHPVVKYATVVRTFRDRSTDHRLMAAHYFPMGAFCLLWARQGAMELLAQGSSIRLPFDNGLQNWLCRAGGGYALSPPLAGVVNVPSDIDASLPHQLVVRGQRHRDPWAGLKKQSRLWGNRFHAWRHLLAERYLPHR